MTVFARRLNEKSVPVNDDTMIIIDSESGEMIRYIKWSTLVTLLSGGASAFTDLTDVPASYTGEALKVVRVNAGETGLEFATISGSGLTQQQVEGLI